MVSLVFIIFFDEKSFRPFLSIFIFSKKVCAKKYILFLKSKEPYGHIFAAAFVGGRIGVVDRFPGWATTTTAENVPVRTQERQEVHT